MERGGAVPPGRSERMKMGLFDCWKKKPALTPAGFEQWVHSQSTQAKSRAYDLQGQQTEQVRLQHPYLFHVTDVETAMAIVDSKQLQGIFPYVTLSQELQGAAQQAEKKGCALIFQFQGSAIVGQAPLTKVTDVAYHHVGSGGYVETFIAHGSKKPLVLLALSFRGGAPLYDVAYVLAKPIAIHVKA